ncbi:MAG: hypothetical protein ACR2GG_08920 [Gemmatimonadaceae bacterium]
MTLRRRLENLESPAPPRADERAMDAEVMQLCTLVGEDTVLEVLARVEADFARPERP